MSPVLPVHVPNIRRRSHRWRIIAEAIARTSADAIANAIVVAVMLTFVLSSPQLLSSRGRRFAVLLIGQVQILAIIDVSSLPRWAIDRLLKACHLKASEGSARTASHHTVADRVAHRSQAGVPHKSCSR